MFGLLLSCLTLIIAYNQVPLIIAYNQIHCLCMCGGGGGGEYDGQHFGIFVIYI